jgi:lia operon protein LiaF
MRLIRSRNRDNTFPDGSGTFHNPGTKETSGPAWTSGFSGKTEPPPFHSGVHGSTNHSHVFHAKQSHSSFIGDFYLTSGRFELQYLHIWHGIGDVRIDLSRAVLTEEEAILDIQALIGNVIIYVPIDLAVSVTASVSIGDLEVLGHHQGGISRQISIATRQYESAPRKVKIFVSLLIGDIDVRYI